MDGLDRALRRSSTGTLAYANNWGTCHCRAGGNAAAARVHETRRRLPSLLPGSLLAGWEGL